MKKNRLLLSDGVAVLSGRAATLSREAHLSGRKRRTHRFAPTACLLRSTGRFQTCPSCLLALLLCPLALPAQDITISGLAVNAGTVTFVVGWNRPATAGDSAWVFVDYNNAGTMTRLLLKESGHAVSAGKIYSPNSKGAWVVAATGSSSTTVQLHACRDVACNVSTLYGACVYATNYPPTGTYTGASVITFRGTPKYEAVLNNAANSPATVSGITSPYTVPAGSYVQSFSDATGAPGRLTPVPFALNASAAVYCAGSSGVGFSLSGTQLGITYQLINKSTGGVVTSLPGTGSAATFSGAHAAGTYYAKSVPTAAYREAVSGAKVISVVATPPTAPTGLSSNVSTLCNGVSTSMTLTATGGSTGSGAVYEWGTGATVGTNPLTPATTTANTRAVSASAATTYWVRLKGTGACSATTTGGVTTAVGTYGAISPGAITTDSKTTTTGASLGVTVWNTTAATGGSGNPTYMWVRSGSDAATLTGSATTYALSSNSANYSTAGTYYINRYVKDATCNTAWVAASGTYTLKVQWAICSSTTRQGQGASTCTLSLTSPVATFQNFSTTYTGSTATLTDVRDCKDYKVVKIAGRWIMAQNLNYQKDLIWQSRADSPTTISGGGVTALIGHFWCPGTDGATTSTPTSCDVWGALYTWETAMMVDGKYSAENSTNTAWSEPSYSTHTSSGNTNNGGKGTNNRGICPTNWHVPTDYEWGLILNEMEQGTDNHNTTTRWCGDDSQAGAGARGKSICNGPATDFDVNWNVYSDKYQGNDAYDFRVLPTGWRCSDGSEYAGRGRTADIWSSSAYAADFAWEREYYKGRGAVERDSYYRSHGFSVRCIRDS